MIPKTMLGAERRVNRSLLRALLCGCAFALLSTHVQAIDILSVVAGGDGAPGSNGDGGQGGPSGMVIGVIGGGGDGGDGGVGNLVDGASGTDGTGGGQGGGLAGASGGANGGGGAGGYGNTSGLQGGGGGGGGGSGFQGGGAIAIDNYSTVRGGNGGNGATFNGVIGSGGGGGNGITLDNATGAAITNRTFASIIGGNGGGGSNSPGAGGSGGSGIVVTGDAVTISNDGGTITGGNAGFRGLSDGNGIVLTGTNGRIYNTGAISGGAAIAVAGDRNMVVNAGGSLVGSGGVGGAGIAAAGNDVRIINYSTVSGGNGIVLTGDGGTIYNTGAITGRTAITITGDRNDVVHDGGSLVGSGGEGVAITGDGNRFELHGGAVLTGKAVATGAGNTFVLGGAATGSFDVGQVSGFDHFEKTGTGTWTLAGVNAAVTPWLVSAGVLSVSADASLGATAGTLTLNGGNLRTTASFTMVRNIILSATAKLETAAGTVLTQNGTFGGPGSLIKTGTGTLILNGINVHTGGTVISAGTLGGTGTLGSTTIAAGAIHAPGNSIGVQTVHGDYTNHGTLLVEATPTDADRVVVSGSVDITGAVLDLVLSPATAANWNVLNGPFTIIDNQGAAAVSGTFASVAQNLLFLNANVAYDGGDGNDVTLTLERNDIDFASVARTSNQRAVATAVGSLDGHNPLVASIALASDADLVRASFDALSGEVHPSTKGMLLGNSHVLRASANDRLRDVFARGGASYAPILAYAPVSTQLLTAPEPDGPAFWSQAYGARTRAASDGNADGADIASGGLLFGADAPVGDWQVGLMAGYGRSSLNASNSAATGSSDTYDLGVYGGTVWGDLALRLGAAYSWHDVRTSRPATIPGVIDTPSSRYGAGTLQAFGELGYGFDLGEATRIEPFGNLALVSLGSEAFTEQGGAAALSVASDRTNVTFAMLGVRAGQALTLGTVDATLNGMVGWQQALGDTTPSSDMRFASGSNFTVAGVPMASNSAVVQLGLNLDFTPSASLEFSYAGQFSPAVSSHSGSAMLAVRF